MGTYKSTKIIISPGDGFHGCGINFSDLCEETMNVGGRLIDAYEEYTSDEYQTTGRMRKGGGLDKLIDCGDAIIEELIGSCRLW